MYVSMRTLCICVIVFFGIQRQVRSETIIRYQQEQLESAVCEENAVCTELMELPRDNYFSLMSCSCPNSYTCPNRPGPSTLPFGRGRWYGLCRPVSDIPQCRPGQVARKQYNGVRDVGYLKYTQINCLCPGDGQIGMVPSTVWTKTRRDDPRADSVFEFECADQTHALQHKRGGRGQGRGGSRRFYFYK
ncbi:uncharacterized protein LOC133202617 isoform X1 [Saccostrea echinata]|uniref:uncharacterized protein LOC133202617 isoform X1 n=1 Tax=Saccostrea echinata TaxID=191078 RepID=UPI002A818719|nr:uncharacterized protein LOC133202617 isoform X1 [Saccostrea echinata]